MIVNYLTLITLSKNLFLFLILIIVAYSSLRAQSYSLQQAQLADRIESVAVNSPPEIAYIQTSKDIYETGEDLWFKVYLLDAQYLVPSLMSKTLYLQLLSESTKKAVWQEKYEIENGFANGRVYLSTDLKEGNYLLAACSPNSLFNDTTEFKAIRRIKVITDIISLKPDSINLDKSRSTSPGTLKSNSIQFNTFPEGGNLVSGITSNLAFKAVNRAGEPVDVKGTLFEDNNPLLNFRSKHAGMGSLNFTPDKSKKYFIRITQPAIDTTFLLPEILSEGMSLALINRNKESLSFSVTHSTGLGLSNFYIRVQSRGVVYGMTSGSVRGEAKIKIPLLLLPQGIAEITLFDASLVPIAERLVYINQDKKLNITAVLSEKSFTQRGKAVLKIKVKDENGQPVIANLGITVFDKIYQNKSDSSNILSHVYLSSQLKGRIYNPSFYFSIKSKDRDEALDLLMLTQGWRKYVWNEMNLKKIEEAHQQVIFNGIRGEIYYPKRKNKIPKEQTFLMAFSPNRDRLNVLIQADTAGGFTVSTDLLKKCEDDYVYLKPFGPHGSQLPGKTYDPLAPTEFSIQIKLTDPFETINRLMKACEISYPLTGIVIDKEPSSDIYTEETGVIKIKEVTIKGHKKNPIRGKYMGSLDSLARHKADDDYVCKYGVLNCPRHDRGEPGTTIPLQGKDYAVIYSYNTPGEYTRRVTYWRPIYTEDELLKLNNLTRVKAYYGPREFYQPNYDKATDESIIPDFRNTLLWEPSVFTSEKGETTLTFFCSDINTDFVGRIEGVGGDGLLGSAYFNFNVRKIKFTP